MATIKGHKLNRLYGHIARGAPLSSEDLALLGISPDLTGYYVRAGWLQRIARGVYCRPNDPLALHPSITLLQRRLAGLHISGKSALAWQGMGDQVALPPILHLRGWQAGHLPDWFTERFPAEYHRNRLFEEQPDGQLHVQPFENRNGAPLISKPERALLEVLSEVGLRQSLREARELVQRSDGLRGDVLLDLLKRCASVKTVRLCLQLGREFQRAWLKELEPSLLPKGSDRAWVWRSADGLLVLKP
ncbi:MAG TPA: type IV toxin-antitoxin system AbiEi family antitoxin domain-containing protein [Stellaceae bacterium]